MAELLSGASTITGGPSFPIGFKGTDGLLIKSSKSWIDGLLTSPDFLLYITNGALIKEIIVSHIVNHDETNINLTNKHFFNQK